MFHEVRFPTDISYGSKGGPGYKTDITVMDSGAEQRIARWSQPRHTFNAAYGVKSYEQLATLKKFFMARQGVLFGFRYKDFTDYNSSSTGFGTTAATDQTIGTGTGSQTQFQLKKNYTSGSTTRVRNIRKPVTSTVSIASDGTPVVSGWTVDTTTGIITFTVAPVLGKIITAGYEFDVPVRFGADIDGLLSLSIDNFGNGSAENIPLMELTDETAVAEEFFFGGAAEISITANLQLAVSSGRLQVIQAQTTSLHVLLPDPADLPPGGPYFYIVNDGSNSFLLRNHLDAAILTLTAGQGVEVALSVDGSNVKYWYTL